MYDYTYWGRHTLSGLDNMALEEHFLTESAQTKNAHLRFYDFAQDTVVLGYGQAIDAVKRWTSDFSVVRRPSGGSHVHVGSNSLAYSVIVPRDGSFVNHQDFRIYYAEKIAAALEAIGLTSITSDHNASTIMHDGKVIASHAVTWGVRSALLHGLVMIDPYDMNRVIDRIHLATRKIGSKHYSEASALAQIPALTRLLTHLKTSATPEQKTEFCKELASKAILRAIAGKSFKTSTLTPAIMQQAATLQSKKYATERWIKQRDPTFTPEQIEAMPGEELNGPLKEKQGYCLYIQVPDKDFKHMAEPRDNP